MFDSTRKKDSVLAKQASPKNGTARVRFIMLEAELPEGDLSQITTAIQNALKPASTTIVQHRLPSTSLHSVGSQDGAVEGDDLEEEDIEQDTETSQEPKKPKRDQKPRTYPTPSVIDVDLKSEISFENYASSKIAKTDIDKFLIVAAWFKEHRAQDWVDADHVYTCFRAVKWSTAIGDFSGPLRSLKKNQLVTSSSRGQYSINHLGLDKVEKLNRE